jgi:hypothetical protein
VTCAHTRPLSLEPACLAGARGPGPTASAHGHPGGERLVNFAAEAFKGRTLVERSFNVFRQWRAVATGDDKFALLPWPGIVLYVLTVWLRT